MLLDFCFVSSSLMDFSLCIKDGLLSHFFGGLGEGGLVSLIFPSCLSQVVDSGQSWFFKFCVLLCVQWFENCFDSLLCSNWQGQINQHHHELGLFLPNRKDQKENLDLSCVKTGPCYYRWCHQRSHYHPTLGDWFKVFFLFIFPLESPDPLFFFFQFFYFSFRLTVQSKNPEKQEGKV